MSSRRELGHSVPAMSDARLARRAASVPEVRYPDELPITARRPEILEAVANHQVVIVAGETGSGKSTQLPKMCLELGRGVRGVVGHTQPRRIAARSVAERVAEELGTTIGGTVGYTVRFNDRASDATLVKVMTDGILLAELQRDRRLDRYDTIIVDEAHERSLNVDFILGYLKQLLPRRPDLKVIITSATINTEKFSEHFDDAPVIEVSGRTYPVELRYRPLVSEAGDEAEERDLVEGILDAVDELRAEGSGDVLVFLSGEREIRDAADALERLEDPELEVLPLYARLSAAEQHRVFQSHSGRRVVLATNVAETSLTVPGIRYVIDPGTARISRFNRRTKVQRLPIEAISQASANQRAGRCGRVAPGVCIRLYSEDDYAARAEFTDPEILRTNLASVILQMTAIGLGDIAAFPFVDPPDTRAINDGIALLDELGALRPAPRTGGEGQRRLTKLGAQLARLPVDPRLGRMVLEAHQYGCLHEVMVIAAALSIQDPRERPAAHREEATAAHARFDDPNSDFLAYLSLWTYLEEQQAARSPNQFRKLCRSEFLNYLRVREWQDVYGQLRQAARSLDMQISSAAGTADAIHRSLLAGLLSHIGMRDERRAEYLGARNARFVIGSGSALAKKNPRWVMAGELVETNRLWGRVAARIQPEWAERAGSHLVKRTHSEPRWDSRRGSAIADERVTLYGLPIVEGRRVAYARIDRAAARELFIWHALIDGDWHASHAFVAHNRGVIDDVVALEDRVRRHDLLVPDEAVFDFYAARLPATVTSVTEFDRWWRDARAREPALLDLQRADVLSESGRDLDLSGFPDIWDHDGRRFQLSYRFAPEQPDDGATVEIPLAALPHVSTSGFDWNVPGYRHELVTELIRSLPRTIRRNFVPAPGFADAFLAGHRPDKAPITDALGAFLRSRTGDPLPDDAWDWTALAPHLRLRFRVIDPDGRAVATGDDLGGLQRRLAEDVRSAVAAAVGVRERTRGTTWDFGTIPKVAEGQIGPEPVRGYPALVDEGATVGLRVYLHEAEQRESMWAGTERLLAIGLPAPAKGVQRRLPTNARLALASLGAGAVEGLYADCTVGAIEERLVANGGPVWDEESFGRLRQAVGRGIGERVAALAEVAAGLIASRARIESRLAALVAPAFDEAAVDIRTQLAGLLHEGFVRQAGSHLDDVVRYVEAVERRLDRLAGDTERDRAVMRRVQRLEDRYTDLMDRLPSHLDGELVDVRWMLEELRVSLFAQSLGTPQPVSEARVERELDRVAAQARRTPD